MANQSLDNATTTDMTGTVTDYEVSAANDTGEGTTFTPEWTKWLGFYKIPELASVIDKKAMWTVGKGYLAKPKIKKILSKIKGNGKESFNGIMYNAIKTYTLAGDYFAEIIKKNGQLQNLKTLNPGRIQIVTDKFGFISGYQLLGNENKIIAKWKPEEIFHLMWNKEGDNTHGQSTVEKLTSDSSSRPGIIEMFNESKQDLKTVFHRYVKPLIISSVDSDNEEEILAFKKKLDNAVNLGENMVVPKDTVDSIERVSIPQFSTLDPLPWMRKLEAEFTKAEGVPIIIQGGSEETTEATAKILYLAFQQMVEWNQLFLEEQILIQLGIEINFEFPASLIDDLQSDEKKDGNLKGVKKSELDPKKAVK